VKALGTRPRVGALVYVVGAGGNKRAPSRRWCSARMATSAR
jgi:hypothetical protein